MDHFHNAGSSTISKEEQIIRDMIIDSNLEYEDPNVMNMEDDVPANTIIHISPIPQQQRI